MAASWHQVTCFTPSSIDRRSDQRLLENFSPPLSALRLFLKSPSLSWQLPQKSFLHYIWLSAAAPFDLAACTIQCWIFCSEENSRKEPF